MAAVYAALLQEDATYLLQEDNSKLLLEPLEALVSPPLFTNTNTFYTQTVSSTYALTASRLDNTQSFYTPIVSSSYALTPSRYDNSQTFYSATVTSSYALTPTRYDNSNSFYSATVTTSYSLAPARYDNSQTFYAPTVTRGAVNLSPSLYSNSQTFYTPIVSRGTITLTPSRLDNTQSFYTPTVTPGAINLLPSLYTNTSSLYEPVVSYIEYRYARPDSDISAGGWTPSTGGDLYAMLDETLLDDADYIQTSTASTCEVSLNPILDPSVAIGHALRYRAKSDQLSTLTATLKQGATTIATDTQVAVPATWTTYTMNLSEAQANSITDYTDLRVTLEAA